MRNSPSTLPRGIRRLFRLPATRERLLREADEEVREHIARWTDEFRASGMSDADAEAAAWARFGDPRDFRDYSARRAEQKARWQHVSDWFVEWGQDVRFAARHLRKAPVFTAIAVLTLALGIGANTAIFSVVHRLLIAPLPYPNGDRIVALKVELLGNASKFAGLASVGTNGPIDPSRPLVRAWRARTRSFETIAGAEPVFLALQANGQQDTVTHAFVTANFLTMLGVAPMLGRGFRSDEEIGSSRTVAMISYEWWQRAYGGRDDALGKKMDYEGQPYTIVGIMPQGFAMPMAPRALDMISNPSPDMWLPASIDSVSMFYGLLRSDVSARDATRELQNIADAAGPLATPLGIRADSMRVHAMRAQDFLAPHEVRTIEILFVAVGALLLIACANVANLLMARAWTRRREFAVRLGLGAGRARIARLAFTESTMLAIIGGAIGIVIAWQGLRVIIGLRPLALDSLSTVRIEPAVLLWTAVVSIATGILFGGATAVFVSSQNVADILRNEVRTSSSGRIAHRTRSISIVGQIALSFALLVGAGLLIRSFVALQRVPMGFDPDHLVSVDILVPPIVRRAGRAAEARRDVVQRLRELPGVIAASVGTLPTAGYRVPGTLAVNTTSGDRLIDVPLYTTTWIDEDYFRATGIAVLAGRVPIPGPTDEAIEQPRVTPGAISTAQQPPPPGAVTAASASFRSLSEEVVINRAFARRVASDGNAVGMRIRVVAGQLGAQRQNAWSTIVGIVDDVRLPGARGDLNDYQIYTLPLARMPDPTFVVRFSVVPPNVESVLRHAIQSAQPNLIVRRGRIAADYVREALAPTRFMLALLGAFAFVALALSVVGLYGSIAYSVTQRTREIGIRVALGASPSAVTNLVLSDGVRLTMIGLIGGLATAVVTSRSLSSLLYDVPASDPMTFSAIAVLVACVALAASYLPARRAVRIDPIEALRAE